MNILDFICLGIVVIFVIYGTTKGVMRFVFRLLATLVAAVAARIGATYLTEFLYNALIKDKVTVQLYKILPSGSVSGGINSLIGTIKEALPASAVKIAEFLHLLPDVSSGTNEILGVSQIEADYIKPIVTKVVLIITTLAIFVIVSVILNMVLKAISKKYFEKKEGAMSALNRAAGGVLGVVRGAIPAAFLCTALLLIAPVIGNEKLSFLVEGSYFCGLIGLIF